MPTLSAADLASHYGWSLALLKSDPTLYATFQAAVKGNWTSDKFVAEVKNTAWFKKNSDTAKQTLVLRNTDPATYAQRKNALIAQVTDAAAKMGAAVPNAKISAIAEQSLMLNWNDSQLRDALSGYVHAVNGVYNGAAQTDVDSLRQTAYRNGVNLDSSTLNSWAQAIAKGTASAGFYQDYIRKQAKSIAPGYATELDSGMDLQDIAAPFMQSKAKILEMNPADINMQDPDVRKALGGVTKDGKPATTSLWQFENQMRADPRWLKTSNAQDSIVGVGHKVLQDMGLTN